MTLVAAIAFRALVALLPGSVLRWLLSGLFPCKTVFHVGPYLSRWILRERADGSADVLHYFWQSDAEAELHNHPWAGEGVILAWGYVDEHRVVARDGGWSIEVRAFPFGARTQIAQDTYHRTRLIDPYRGAWTYFSMGPRGKEWQFWDRSHDTYEPWEAAVARRRLQAPTLTRPWRPFRRERGPVAP